MDKNQLEEVVMALEIIKEKGTPYEPSVLGFKTAAKKMVRYKDEAIEIIAAEDTQVLNISIKPPLTDSSKNPVLCRNDEGEIYRSHGELFYFKLYAQLMLGKPVVLNYPKRHEEILAKMKEIIERNK